MTIPPAFRPEVRLLAALIWFISTNKSTKGVLGYWTYLINCREE